MIPKPRKNVKVIDLGCGAGRFAMYLKRRAVTNYLGIDFSATRIEKAQVYVPTFEFLGH